MPARLTVSRKLPIDVQQRQIFVSLDGQPFATLVFGQSKTREIAPGRHQMKVHNTLVWKSFEVDIEDGQDVTFDVANRPGRWLLGALALLGVGPLFLTVERRSASASV